MLKFAGGEGNKSFKAFFLDGEKTKGKGKYNLSFTFSNRPAILLNVTYLIGIGLAKILSSSTKTLFCSRKLFSKDLLFLKNSKEALPFSSNPICYEFFFFYEI